MIDRVWHKASNSRRIAHSRCGSTRRRRPEMIAPTVCVLLPGTEPSLRPSALFDVRRYGFETLFLVDTSDPRGASPDRTGLKVCHVASTALVGALHNLIGSDETVMLVAAGRTPTRVNWLDLVPRLAAQRQSHAAVAFGSEEPSTPVAALLTRRAIRLLDTLDPLAALAAHAESVAVHYELSDPSHDGERPAVFFDRDGVINADHGYVGEISRFAFLPDAIAGVKAANDRGALAFLVTNQSGVARGYYTEQDVADLHRHMSNEMRRHGAHFDDIRTCPHLPDGVVAAYRLACRCRKPEPGMLLDLMRHWPIDRTRSVMIGDKGSDMEAAQAAGVTGTLYGGSGLADLVAASLNPDDQPAGRNKRS